MSARILNAVLVDATPSIVSSPTHVLDDATRAMLAGESAAAHARGVAEGHAAAVEAARAEAVAVAAAVDAGISRLVAAMSAQHEDLAQALATRVIDATRAVLGKEPDDEGQALVERLADAIARTDDPSLIVRVSMQREAVAREALAGRVDVTVEVDDTLVGDDALVAGAFAQLDLRQDGLLASLGDVLADMPPLGPIPPATEQDAS